MTMGTALTIFGSLIMNTPTIIKQYYIFKGNYMSELNPQLEAKGQSGQ